MILLKFVRDLSINGSTIGAEIVKIQRSSAHKGNTAFVLVYPQDRAYFLENKTTPELLDITGEACKVFALAVYDGDILRIGPLVDLQEW